MYAHLYIATDSRPASSEERRFFSLISSRSHSALPGSWIKTTTKGPPHDFHKKKCSGITIILRFDNQKTQTPFSVPKPLKNGELETRSWEINCTLPFVIFCHLYQHFSEFICSDKLKQHLYTVYPNCLPTTISTLHIALSHHICTSAFFPPSHQYVVISCHPHNHFCTSHPRSKKSRPDTPSASLYATEPLSAVTSHIVYIIILSLHSNTAWERRRLRQIFPKKLMSGIRS